MDFSSERREYPRVPKGFRIELSSISFSGDKKPGIETRCLNVSAGGILLEAGTSFRIGDRVQVRIYLPRLYRFHPSYFKVFESSTGQNLVAVAEVVRVNEKVALKLYEIGLKFLDIYEDDWQALVKLLESELISAS